MSSGAWVLGGLRGCLPRSPRLGVGWGTRTLNPKGLRGLEGEWGGFVESRLPGFQGSCKILGAPTWIP